MGTVVLVAALLLAASATPLENLPGNSAEHTSYHPEEEPGPVSPSFPDAVSQTDTEYNTADPEEKPDNDSDTIQSSSEHNTSVNNGDEPTSSDSTVSPSTKLSAEDDVTNNNTDDATTSLDNSASENWTQPASELPSTTNYASPPPDDDPNDCNIRDGANHVYQQCEFVCQMDEVETAPENATCYLNQTQTLSQLPGVRSRTEEMEKGVCINGSCIRPPSETSLSTSTTEASTGSSTTETLVSTSTTDASKTTSTATSMSIATTAAPMNTLVDENNTGYELVN